MNRGTPARLALIRQIAERRQKSGAHERSLKKIREKGLDFVLNPRMPKSATLREARDEDLISDIGGRPIRREADEVNELVNEYGLNKKPYTSATQKLHALWEARRALGLKPGEQVQLSRLIVPAAHELQVLPSTVRNFVNNDMTSPQRMALKTGLLTGEVVPKPEVPNGQPEPALAPRVAEKSSLSPIPRRRGSGPAPAATDHERLSALAKASVELRGGNANKQVSISDLAAKAAPDMMLSKVSTVNYVGKLNKAQKKLLGIATRRSRKDL